jgi:DNA-binding Xre family transcriptional regulator
MEKKPMFKSNRMNELMEKRDLDPGKIEYLADISRSQVWYLQKGEKPNVSAVIVARIAKILNCSVDYLMDLTDDPTPVGSRNLPPDFIELWEVYQSLSEIDRKRLLVQVHLLNGDMARVSQVTAAMTGNSVPALPEDLQGFDRILALAQQRMSAADFQKFVSDLRSELGLSGQGHGQGHERGA